ncbi:MAG: hypothetical protein IKY67_05950 [Paludibacteraceae bacterium]|nr:hypothetical protein [Paludibacteraceae bacterium]
MRIWSWQLLPYLPDLQFKGQLRELVATMHDWRDKGKTNHLLINMVMNFSKEHLKEYFELYHLEYVRRYKKEINKNIVEEFNNFDKSNNKDFVVFYPWHNKEYLRVCMANLYEKHYMGIGKSRITDEEWAILCEGYKTITGEDYSI